MMTGAFGFAGGEKRYNPWEHVKKTTQRKSSLKESSTSARRNSLYNSPNKVSFDHSRTTAYDTAWPNTSTTVPRKQLESRHG